MVEVVVMMVVSRIRARATGRLGLPLSDIGFVRLGGHDSCRHNIFDFTLCVAVKDWIS